jgi:hypothetical protein
MKYTDIFLLNRYFGIIIADIVKGHNLKISKAKLHFLSLISG